nr:DnaD domain protein [Clostridium sp.]
MTNSKTTQCGIYDISKITIETDTGYNRETVEKLIQRFCDYKKILYCDETKELMVINWIKYNVPSSINSLKCVHKEILKVKHKAFIKILFAKCLAAGLDVEKIFGNLITKEVDEKPAVEILYEKVDKPSVELSNEDRSEEIFMEGRTEEFSMGDRAEEISEKVKNVGAETGNNFEKTEKIQKTSQFIINKPLGRGLVEDYKPLPSNRIRSNKEEVISNKQEVINKKEEEEEEEVISKKEAITKNKIITKFKDDSAATADNNKTDDDGLKNIIKVFEENVHAITPLEYGKILGFTKHVASEVIIMAIDEAVNYNAKTMMYITKILDSWISHGIKTGEEVKAYQKKWASKKVSYQSQNGKKGGFCDYEQRSYDFETLEKQLLGHLDTEENTEE